MSPQSRSPTWCGAGEFSNLHSTRTTCLSCETACLSRLASRLLLCASRRPQPAATPAASPAESRTDLSCQAPASYRRTRLPAPNAHFLSSPTPKRAQSPPHERHTPPLLRASSYPWTQIPTRHWQPRECPAQLTRIAPACRLAHSSWSNRAAACASRARPHKSRRATVLLPESVRSSPT